MAKIYFWQTPRGVWMATSNINHLVYATKWCIAEPTSLRGLCVSWPHFTDADLRGFDLSGTQISGGVWTNADLRDMIVDYAVPVVPRLDAAVLEAIEADSTVGALNMTRWHMPRETAPSCACGTAHCRGGWIIHLAGAAGYDLERRCGPAMAAALIYARSTGRRVPNFYSTADEAVQDIRRCAALNDAIAKEIS